MPDAGRSRESALRAPHRHERRLFLGPAFEAEPERLVLFVNGDKIAQSKGRSAVGHRYQTLRHFDDAPQLPSGYGLMLGLAYVPPPVAHGHGQAGARPLRRGCDEVKREKVLAKYR